MNTTELVVSVAFGCVVVVYLFLLFRVSAFRKDASPGDGYFGVPPRSLSSVLDSNAYTDEGQTRLRWFNIAFGALNVVGAVFIIVVVLKLV